MINRNVLVCTSCSEKITIRVSFGLGEKQIHTFACPSCHIEIVVTVDIDQTAVKWSYRDPINGKWLENVGTEETRFVKTFDPENLIPRETGGIPAFPFVMTFHNSVNPRKAARDDAIRKHVYKTIWPIVRRLRTHFDNRAISLFDKEMKALGNDFSGQTWQARIGGFCSLTEKFFQNYSLAQKSARTLARKIISTAAKKRTVDSVSFAQHCIDSGQIGRLWTQVWEVREKYMQLFPVLNPLIKFSEWKPGFSIKDYYLSEKRFTELKPLYADSYESFSKLSTLAIGFEQLSKSQPLIIPTQKGGLTLEEYDGLPNGSKPDHLKKFTVGSLFIPFMDNHLRNGIGHNSAHYVVGDDAVWYRSSRSDKVVEEKIDYTEFCHKLLQVVSATEVATLFLGGAMYLGQKNTHGLKDF